MKKIFHWILTKLPRPFLIRMSYIFRAFAPLFFGGNKFEDPIDGRTYRRLLPYGALDKRENALAPFSLSLERHRLQWLFMKERTNFFTADKLKVLHVAPEQCFLERFRKQKNLDYTTGDLFSPLADVKMDLHEIPFDDNTFDVVFCNHVLEHVEDYHQCMTELHRVMKPGGWGIFQVPIDYNRYRTFEDPSITSEEDRLKYYRQKDHVRLFGLDYEDHLANAGFVVKAENFGDNLEEGLKERYALPGYELMYYCEKA